MDEHLTTREAARFLGVTPEAVQNWRRQGWGPRPLRDIPGAWYTREELEAFKQWLDATGFKPQWARRGKGENPNQWQWRKNVNIG